jgi:hypothetical protein
VQESAAACKGETQWSQTRREFSKIIFFVLYFICVFFRAKPKLDFGLSAHRHQARQRRHHPVSILSISISDKNVFGQKLFGQNLFGQLFCFDFF